MRNIFRKGRHAKLKLGKRTEQKDPHQQHSPWPPRSKVKVVRSRDTWQALADKSSTKRPRNTKIGRKIVHPAGDNAHQFQGQRQRSRSPGQHNVETGSEVRHIFRTERPTNFKIGVQMKYEDPYRRDGPGPSPARSNVKITMSRGSSDRCWPISLVRKVPETSKLVCNFKGKRSKIKLDYCWD